MVGRNSGYEEGTREENKYLGSAKYVLHILVFIASWYYINEDPSYNKYNSDLSFKNKRILGFLIGKSEGHLYFKMAGCKVINVVRSLLTDSSYPLASDWWGGINDETKV